LRIGGKKFHILFEGMTYQIVDVTTRRPRRPTREDEASARKLFWKFVNEFDIEL